MPMVPPKVSRWSKNMHRFAIHCRRGISIGRFKIEINKNEDMIKIDEIKSVHTR